MHTAANPVAVIAAEPAAPVSISSLIAEGAELNARIKANAKRLEVIEAEVLKLGPGKHAGEGNAKCLVISPAGAIKLKSETIEAVKKSLGPVFRQLFDRVISFKAKKEFRALLAALVPSEAKRRKVLTLTEQPASSYVKWD